MIVIGRMFSEVDPSRSNLGRACRFDIDVDAFEYRLRPTFTTKNRLIVSNFSRRCSFSKEWSQCTMTQSQNPFDRLLSFYHVVLYQSLSPLPFPCGFLGPCPCLCRCQSRDSWDNIRKFFPSAPKSNRIADQSSLIHSFALVRQVANLGKYGSFVLTISPSQSFMSWTATLKNLGELTDTPTLSYHLHNQWTSTSANYAITADCASSNAGGHYDPYLGCGPSSAAGATSCTAIGRVASSGYTYTCNPAAYSAGELDRCEVGDLSGKYGPIQIINSRLRRANTSVRKDPLPALNYHYESSMSSGNTAAVFASVVFHKPDGSRVLCGKLVRQ
jgi:hypothetical protein